jgi:two-component system, OmpR family, response regulator ResD
METSILIVDDEVRIRDLLKLYLVKEHFRVLEADNGREALAIVKREVVHLLILDVMMPEMDGWSVCKNLRELNNHTPVIMLTARGDEADRLTGFELGVDDYIVKPFSSREVVARVKAILKRTAASIQTDGVFNYPGFSINAEARQVIVKGQPLNLTPKEFDLLLYLARRPGRVASREQILEQVWGYDFYGDLRTVDTHIKQLREKLTRQHDIPNYIHTVWGTGYKFEVQHG